MSIIISRIEAQKKNKNRFNLYADDKFLMGVSDESLLTFNIHKGQNLTTTALNKIRHAEELISIREQALRFLARRAHSKKELIIKLQKKNFPLPTINIIVHELEEKKMIDDRAFTKSFIQDEILLKKNGPDQIKHRLYIKGIEKTLITDMLESEYDESLQLANCKFHSQKKYKTLTKYPYKKQKQKLVTFLRQKGFSWEMIQTTVSLYVKEEEDETF
jgi:regulatory protein